MSADRRARLVAACEAARRRGDDRAVLRLRAALADLDRRERAATVARARRRVLASGEGVGPMRPLTVTRLLSGV